MKTCDTCNTLILSGDNHTCLPVYWVWPVCESPEDAQKVFAVDDDDAAETYAKDYDHENDYVIAESGDEGYEVFVRADDAKEAVKRLITAERVTEYTALEVE